MNHFVEAFKKFFVRKQFKYGAYSTVLTVVFLAILIVINLLVGKFVDFEKDLTKNKLFSFEDQTMKVLSSLKQPINIYALYSQGEENEFIMEIVERYKKESGHINVEIVDPVKNPGFVKDYDKEGQGISNGSFIVENSETKRFKIIRSYDLVDYSYGSRSADSLVAEQRFTSAILYVTSDKVPTVYFTQGHGETEMFGIEDALERENYERKQVNLLTEDIPEDASVLVIASPKKDFSADEIEKLDKYFDKGGRAAFMFDVAKDRLNKLEDYLAEWGVELHQDFVVEGNENMFFRHPTYLVPNIQSHEITGAIKSNGLMMLMPMARSFEILFKEKGNIKVESLIKSSDNSWGKVNFESKTTSKEQGDLEGPLNIAVAISRKNYDEDNNYKELKETKILVVGNTGFLSRDMLTIPGHANMDFFMNSLNWMQDEEEKISIRPKSLQYEQLNMTSYSQILVYAGLVVIVIPLIVFILGAVVWARRRHL